MKRSTILRIWGIFFLLLFCLTFGCLKEMPNDSNAQPVGYEWEVRSKIGLADVTDIIWANNQWMTVGSGAILVSGDARTWKSVYNGAPGILEAVTWSGSHYIAVGANCILTSPDGLIWTLKSTPFTWYVAVAASETLAVAIAKSGKISVSSNLIDWTDKQIGSAGIVSSVLYHPTTPFVLNDTVVSEGSFILGGGGKYGAFCRTAVGDTFNIVNTSLQISDLVTWNSQVVLVAHSGIGFLRDSGLVSGGIGALAADHCGDQLVMVGPSGFSATADLNQISNENYRSVPHATGTGVLFRSIACNDNGCVGVGYSGWIVASPPDRPKSK